MPALLALASACSYGIADFLGGIATRKAAVVAVTLISNLAGAVLAVILAFAIEGEWTMGAIGWGAAGGFGGLVGVVLLYQGLADGPNRLVSPLSAVVAAIVPIVIGVSLGDRPNALAIVGLAIAPAAIWLVAGGDIRIGEASKRPLWFGIGAGLGFGASFALLAQTPDDAGAVPLLGARAASLTILVRRAHVTYHRPGRGKRPGEAPARPQRSPSPGHRPHAWRRCRTRRLRAPSPRFPPNGDPRRPWARRSSRPHLIT